MHYACFNATHKKQVVTFHAFLRIHVLIMGLKELKIHNIKFQL